MASARQPAIPHMHVPNGVCKVLGTDPTVGRSRRGQGGQEPRCAALGLTLPGWQILACVSPFCPAPWDTGCGGDHPHATGKPETAKAVVLAQGPCLRCSCVFGVPQALAHSQRELCAPLVHGTS